jgi:hypothetical protein
LSGKSWAKAPEIVLSIFIAPLKGGTTKGVSDKAFSPIL